MDTEPPRRDFLTIEERSARMSLIKASGTKPELALEQRLRDAGMGFETGRRDMPGKPDFVLTCAKVIVFLDGDFWHGKNFQEWEHKLSPYWLAKIQRNMARDRKNNAILRAAGWSVIRIWESDFTKRPKWCLQRIKRACWRKKQRAES